MLVDDENELAMHPSLGAFAARSAQDAGRGVGGGKRKAGSRKQ